MHVPARVQIRLPAQEPWSATAAPFVDWANTDPFPLADVMASWGLDDSSQDPVTNTEGDSEEFGGLENSDVEDEKADSLTNDSDDIPF